MATVRRGAGGFLKYFTPLFALLVLVQVFLAGWGIFGIEEGGLEEAVEEGDLGLHVDFGHILAQLGGLLFLIASLLWWPARKRLLGLYILLVVLLVVQIVLAAAGESVQFLGALHPVNAFVILGLVLYLSWWFWRRREPSASDRPPPA